ncbi:MAG: DMT family transporter [Candidatus Tectomicrobia bacterium]
MTNHAQVESIEQRRYTLAFSAVLLSSCLNSVGGLLVRSLETATDWQIVFYRGMALAVAMSVLFILRYRNRVIVEFRRIGRWNFAGGLFYGAATACYVLSLTHTTVANTLFVLSAIPFFTAVLAWVFLKESVRRGTWIAMAAALVGVGVMVGEGFAAGTVFGNLTALVSALSFSCFVVTLRRDQATDMLPSVGIGALIATLTAALMAGGDLAVLPGDLALCIVWGGIVSCTAQFLLVFGSRQLLGAELTLLVLVEFILGPFWVWLFVNEVPSILTLIGGVIVLSAVAGRALTGMRPRPPHSTV